MSFAKSIPSTSSNENDVTRRSDELQLGEKILKLKHFRLPFVEEGLREDLKTITLNEDGSYHLFRILEKWNPSRTSNEIPSERLSGIGPFSAYSVEYEV